MMSNDIDNLGDIIASLSKDDTDMLKGVAASILGNDAQQEKEKPSADDLGLDGIDFNMIMKAKSIFDKMNNTPNKNVDLILALKPHLKPETQSKADQALRILKLFEILPLLKELF